jgi:hypothetical protein
MCIRNFIFIFLHSLFLFSCEIPLNEKNKDDPEEINNSFEDHMDSSMDETFNESNYPLNFMVNIDFFQTTPSDEKKFDEAIEMIKRVVSSSEFKERVLNHTYNGVKTFVDNRGLSNFQIYKMIIEGAEILNKMKNNTLDMEVELYYADSSTVGYTISNSPRVWVNTKYFYVYPISGVASNLMHEWLHKLGFRHASVYSPSRDYSVPYAIGRMVGSLGKKL